MTQIATKTAAGLMGPGHVERLDSYGSRITLVESVAASAIQPTDSDVSGSSWVLDEDDFASNSPTKVPTQQSVKAYVDANAGGGWTLVGSETISTPVDTVMILIPSGYTQIKVFGKDMQHNSGTNTYISLSISRDGGVSIDVVAASATSAAATVVNHLYFEMDDYEFQNGISIIRNWRHVSVSALVDNVNFGPTESPIRVLNGPLPINAIMLTVGAGKLAAGTVTVHAK